MLYDGDIKNKRILLHACCGPCSLGAIEPLLSDGADLTLFFYNPCIIDGEFEKRLAALRSVASHYKLPLVVPEHDYSAYLAYAKPHASLPEGGDRCRLCFADRLRVSAEYAAEHGFDMYTTTLTVSPHKNSKLIFSIAGGFDFGAPFLPRDFKKRDGYLLSCRRAKELDIYRQKFCGCEFSLPASGGDA
ncbi:MAG: epoxyqueuosine reductase QueH [Clostridia bacterium]|nr:epoxyqueuosine reductase QueH [Clostridia bacterium]